ncbi:MAG: gliding motility lipoprotein GldJ [Verrucomicrobia bacterium]|nr:gliding motility lipoprotein GldJ [Cytophagales bacterium]
MKQQLRLLAHLLVAGLLLFSACKRGKTPTAQNPGKESTATGLAYNEDPATSFQVNDFEGQPAGPNLVFIEGGRTVLGSREEDILYAHDNIERTVSIQSFWMDETEVANIHWLEYMYFINLSDSIPDDEKKSTLPDTTVWATEFAFNDSYVDHYLRYPGFRFFPVVGVTWNQCLGYCKWRTTAVNLAYAKGAGKEQEYNEGKLGLESGLMLPAYRLPSEAEWEYAAQALIGTQYLDENQSNQRIYPWDGHALRNPYGKQMGNFLANFKRGRGDYAGIAGKLNDAALITAAVYDYPPNDYGLYNMAGNVNEWVYDIYRPLAFEDFDDLNPIRRIELDPETKKEKTKGKVFLDPGEGYNKAFSLIDDEVRVFKGGSWKDVAYWLSPGTRRYLKQDSATATIGFRCAVINAGSNR